MTGTTPHSGTDRKPDAQALAAARRVIGASSKVGEDYTTAEIFPAEAYTGEDFWRFERWALFERQWLCVGHVNQLPEPGTYFSITVVEEPLIVTRDEEGEIHVLSAICQHRGHPLRDGLDPADDKGRCAHGKLLICPYHAWSYKLDGSLLGAPGMSKTAPIAELRKRASLPRVRHTIFHGLIFVNFDPDAPPLENQLGKMNDLIANYGIADLVPAPTVISGDIKSNWKIYQENSLEPYHTDVVHRNSHNPAPAHLSKFYDCPPEDGAIYTTTGFLDDAELFTADGANELAQIEGLTDDERSRILFIAVLPMLFILCESSSVLITLALPGSAGTMKLLTFSLYPEEATRHPRFAEIYEAQAAALTGIVQEDLVTQEALQRGHQSRYTPKGVLSWLETTIPQMNGWLLQRYRSALEEAER
ncbi:aromatic ring-hydroxylating oxygenase subunit alpha [Novosphingobium album (ex Hu et al. 2023)]|uniref:Aromatic ring-hydroxylating dioxygenase subunit alpha n=1 Tax=Novosphingobium album (ex Hu et al. 2023) TaxID=2930093 RepID=A0ABT0B4N1_9SPHN|nr:aromatic ring-hydroxylating dioxygenase subunit alpha [Novosphingobium album (ex Hu et al. 2023)]MCJ2179990.1 aromatic ring-hydroxylating dioxygenase subunit alpha [Novosphingobium album (ex Hu et al. 2023)]